MINADKEPGLVIKGRVRGLVQAADKVAVLRLNFEPALERLPRAAETARSTVNVILRLLEEEIMEEATALHRQHGGVEKFPERDSSPASVPSMAECASAEPLVLKD